MGLELQMHSCVHRFNVASKGGVHFNYFFLLLDSLTYNNTTSFIIFICILF